MKKAQSSQGKNKSKKLDARLLAYCALAGGSLAAAVTGEAAYVYSGLKNLDVGGGNGTELNFDNEGPAECTIIQTFTSSLHVRKLLIDCSSSQSAKVLRSGPTLAHKFTENDLISKDLGIWGNWGMLAYYQTLTPYNSGGNFLGMSGYMGIRFVANSQTHYGWLQFQGDSLAAGGTVIDWAYESEDNGSIPAGAMPTTSSISTSSSSTTTTTIFIDTTTSTTTSIDDATTTTTIQDSTTTTMPASPCTLRVVPGRISPLLRTLQPFAPFIIIGDENAAFTKNSAIDWGTTGISTIFKLPLGKRMLLVLARVRAADLDKGETYSVVVDSCSGEMTAGR